MRGATFCGRLLRSDLLANMQDNLADRLDAETVPVHVAESRGALGAAVEQRLH